MKKTIYHENPMIVRDYLALERTRLANTRTLLAYSRTAIGSFGAGAGIVKLLEYPEVTPVGYVLMVIAPIIMVIGVVHFIRVARKWSGLDK